LGGISSHLASRVLSEQKVTAIGDGKLNAFLFMRVIIKGRNDPIESCYLYRRETKDFVNCIDLHPAKQKSEK
jgi:hypothetical protein